jgi:chromosome segregation ATPase
LKLAQSFAIQVDNLCQFLPQDKVAEFAALSPIELLHSTQRAAAGPEMLAWHDALKTLRSKQKKLELDNSGEKETLVNLENRQEMQRADVEKMRERAEIKRRIEILELCRPIVHYKEHFETVRTLREEKAHIEQEYRQLKADNEPILLAVQAKENYIAELNGAKDDRKDAADHAASLATRHGNEIDKFDAKIKALDAQIDAERKSSKDQKAQATHTQQTIKKLERQLEEEAVEFNPESYNEALVRNIRILCHRDKPSNNRIRERNVFRGAISRPKAGRSRIDAIPLSRKADRYKDNSSRPKPNWRIWTLRAGSKSSSSRRPPEIQ